MSNEQWPQGQNPWAQQDPHWKPQSYQETQGRDPLKPFGTDPATEGPAPSVQDYQEPSRRSSPWALAFGAIVIIGAILLGLQLLGGDEPSPAPSESTRARPTEVPTAETTGNAIPFEGNGNGTFELLDESWSGNDLRLRVRITVTSGDHNFLVYMFDNETMQIVEPTSSSPLRATKDQPYEDVVTFHNIERGAATLVLANEWNRALTALPVEG